MQTYYVNEAAFALPDRTFVDRTLHRFELPTGADTPIAIEIRRLPVDAGKSLRDRVDAEVEAASASVAGFSLLDRIDADVGGAPAILLRARLRANDEAYVQLKAHVVFRETWITLAVTGPTAARDACEETFERLVRTTSWRAT